MSIRTRSIVFGYYGAQARTDQFDEAIEKFLRAAGMTTGEAARFLTSSNFRHFMDKIKRTTELDVFEAKIRRRYVNALEDLHSWPEFFERTYHVQVTEHRSSVYAFKADDAEEAKRMAIAMFPAVPRDKETWTDASIVKVTRSRKVA